MAPDKQGPADFHGQLSSSPPNPDGELQSTAPAMCWRQAVIEGFEKLGVWNPNALLKRFLVNVLTVGVRTGGNCGADSRCCRTDEKLS